MASRTTGRTSARSSVSRDQASSPPKLASDRQSHSPVARRTRSTRSQSVDLGESDSGVTTRKGARRTMRQGSVESVDSNASAASSIKVRPSRKTRTARTSPELSILAEDQEPGQDEEEAANTEDPAGAAQSPQSPGGMSQMSGTTVLTSASAKTSHSVEEIEALDPMVVEYLPELLASSCKILDLLAPSGATSETVELIVRDLRVVGSRRAKRLKHDEEKFQADRENYGSDDYINPVFIRRRLFGTQDIKNESSRPDDILHAANLATLVKSLLVTQKQSRATLPLLQMVDIWFPEVFLTEFGDNGQAGSSLLLNESFEMSLEIRTQCAIIALLVLKEAENWNPEQILLSSFLDLPSALQNSLPMPDFEQVLNDGRVLSIMRKGPENSEEQNDRIKSRIREIRKAFQLNNDAVEAGDLVDFERLDEMFPWAAFLTRLVQWSRLRLDEIISNINHQGGLDHIVISLIEAVRENNSQIELEYDPPPATMGPAAIKPSNAGRNLYVTKNVFTLEKLKRERSSGGAPSNPVQQRIGAANLASSHANQAGPFKIQTMKPSENVKGAHQQGLDHVQPVMLDDESGPVRSTQEYLSTWDTHIHDKNKENRPVSDREETRAAKRSIFDRQENARREEWDDWDSVPSKLKRSRQHREADEDSEEGFQDDQRLPNPGRRTAVPTARHRYPIPVARTSPKRARLQSPDDEITEARRRNRQAIEAALQDSARRAASGSEGEEEEEDEEQDEEEEEEEGQGGDRRLVPTAEPNFAEIRAHARYAAAKTTQPSRATQRRVFWSAEDEQHFIDLIEEYGCSWAHLAKIADFQHERNQVSLKDKARNMKVSFLKSGTPLPINFDKIALGKKEIAAVRAVIPDYDEPL